MGFMSKTLIAVATVFAAQSVAANPVEHSCHFLEVMGNNRVGDVQSMMGSIAPEFSQDRVSQAVSQFETLLRGSIFDGGSAWLVGKLGDDLEEHLIILRLSEGEVAGARLRYEWSADAPKLASIEFKRQFAEYAAQPFLQALERIDCG